MRNKDADRAAQLEAALVKFGKNVESMPGIDHHENLLVLVEQLIDSIRRVHYVHVIREKEHNSERANPKSELFDPLKAAVINLKNGNIDEAFERTTA